MSDTTTPYAEAGALVGAVLGGLLAAAGVGVAGLTPGQVGSGLAALGFAVAAILAGVDRHWERSLGWALGTLGFLALAVFSGREGPVALLGVPLLLVAGVVLLWTARRPEGIAFPTDP